MDGQMHEVSITILIVDSVTGKETHASIPRATSIHWEEVGSEVDDIGALLDTVVLQHRPPRLSLSFRPLPSEPDGSYMTVTVQEDKG